MARLSIDVRLLIAEIAIPVLLLCAVDIAFGHFVAQSRTAPLPNLFPYPLSTAKYLAYRQLASEREPLDLLLMGMSQMVRANMGLIQRAVARDRGTGIRGFNFAAPLQSVEFNRRLLEDVLLPIKAPRLLVHGFVPKNLLYEESADWVASMARSLPVFAMHSGTPAAHLQDFVFEHSDLMKYREVIRDRLVLEPPQQPFASALRLARTTDRLGDVSLDAPVRPVNRLNPWERETAEQFAGFDDLLARTMLFEHIGDLARTCRTHGIQLIVLNNAVHPIALQELPRGRDDYDRFVDALRNAAEANGVPFFSPAEGGIGEPDLFEDAVHHNQAGTRWLSEQIARFLLERGLFDRQPPAAATPAAGP